MPTFEDTKGRTWSVEITIGLVKQLRKHPDVQVDLLDVTGGDVFTKLVADPVLLCDVLYLLVKEQADAAGVGDEDFGRAMGGDAIHQATNAFLEALVNFFQSQNPQKGQVLQEIRRQAEEVDAKLADKAVELLRSPELKTQIEQEIEALGPPSIGSPAKSESSPTA